MTFILQFSHIDYLRKIFLAKQKPAFSDCPFILSALSFLSLYPFDHFFWRPISNSRLQTMWSLPLESLPLEQGFLPSQYGASRWCKARLWTENSWGEMGRNSNHEPEAWPRLTSVLGRPITRSVSSMGTNAWLCSASIRGPWEGRAQGVPTVLSNPVLAHTEPFHPANDGALPWGGCPPTRRELIFQPQGLCSQAHSHECNFLFRVLLF